MKESTEALNMNRKEEIIRTITLSNEKGLEAILLFSDITYLINWRVLFTQLSCRINIKGCMLLNYIINSTIYLNDL